MMNHCNREDENRTVWLNRVISSDSGKEFPLLNDAGLVRSQGMKCCLGMLIAKMEGKAQHVPAFLACRCLLDGFCGRNKSTCLAMLPGAGLGLVWRGFQPCDNAVWVLCKNMATMQTLK